MRGLETGAHDSIGRSIRHTRNRPLATTTSQSREGNAAPPC